MNRDGEGLECLQRSKHAADVALKFQSEQAIYEDDEPASKSTDRLNRPI